MGAIFQSLGRTVAAGVVLLIIIVALFGNIQFNPAWHAFFMRWLHVVCGVMWIGLLWYFNFVQIPSMPKIPDEQKPAIGKVIAPTALFWFRWAALATVVTGVLLAVARIAGETAPLLFTALSNQFWTSSLSEPMASLPVTIFKFAMSPYENWQALAWAGVFLITLGVLALNILARILFRKQS